MKKIRLFLLISVLAMSALAVPGSRYARVDDPPNACQICADECRAAFPKDPAKQRRCILSCECNPPAPGDSPL